MAANFNAAQIFTLTPAEGRSKMRRVHRPSVIGTDYEPGVVVGNY